MQEQNANLSVIDNYSEEINGLHDGFIALGRKNTEGLIRQINLAREIGIKLMAAKALPESRGRFKQMFSKSGTVSTFGFSYDTAFNYMRVANLLPDPIISLPEGVRVLSDMFRMGGALPEPDGSGRAPKGTRQPFETYAPKLGDAVAALVKWQEVEPVDNWSETHKEHVMAQIEPIVELYRELGGAA